MPNSKPLPRRCSTILHRIECRPVDVVFSQKGKSILLISIIIVLICLFFLTIYYVFAIFAKIFKEKWTKFIIWR